MDNILGKVHFDSRDLSHMWIYPYDLKNVYIISCGLKLHVI